MNRWPGLDQRRHLPVEEGEQQRADMRAVDIGVGHDDDLVVAELGEIELVMADAGAERGDQRADLLAPQHLVEARPLDVEDLAAQGQHRLEGAVARLLGAAAGLNRPRPGTARTWRDRAPGSRRACRAARPCRARPCGGSARAPCARPRAPRPPRRSSARCCGPRPDSPRTIATSASAMTLSTTGRTSEETSLSLVWLENFGSGTLTDSTQVSPSRASSPVSATFSFLAMPEEAA